MNCRNLVVLGLATVLSIYGSAGIANGSTISGTVVDAATMEGTCVSIIVIDSNGQWHPEVLTNSDCGSGEYTTEGSLPDGTYYVRTQNQSGYFDELYDDILCNVGSCNEVAEGAPIVVAGGSPATGIDFVIVPGGGRISGTVTNVQDGSPATEIIVSLFDPSGNKVTHGYVWMNDGTYISDGGLHTGTYYAKTWSNYVYLDELYDDLPCNDGCDVTLGTPISITVGEITTGIDFALIPASVFTDGFEDGDTSAWSGAVQ